jgi:hypothetical protein
MQGIAWWFTPVVPATQEAEISGIFFLFWLDWGLKSGLHPCESRHSTALATPPVHFPLVILEMGVSQTSCLDWPQTEILPISASQEARITGMSHQCLGQRLLV